MFTLLAVIIFLVIMFYAVYKAPFLIIQSSEKEFRNEEKEKSDQHEKTKERIYVPTYNEIMQQRNWE